jgi:hypothetical protein
MWTLPYMNFLINLDMNKNELDVNRVLIFERMHSATLLSYQFFFSKHFEVFQTKNQFLVTLSSFWSYQKVSYNPIEK